MILAYPFNFPKVLLIFVLPLTFLIFWQDHWDITVTTFAIDVAKLRKGVLTLLVISMATLSLLPAHLGLQESLEWWQVLRAAIALLSIVASFCFLIIRLSNDSLEYAKICVGCGTLFLLGTFLAGLVAYFQSILNYTYVLLLLPLITVVAILTTDKNPSKVRKLSLKIGDLVIILLQLCIFALAIFPQMATGTVIDDDVWRLLSQSWLIVRGTPLSTFASLTNFYPLMPSFSLSSIFTFVGMPLNNTYVILTFFASFPMIALYLVARQVCLEYETAVFSAIVFTFSTSFGGITNMIVAGGVTNIWWNHVRWLDVLAGPSYSFQANLMSQTVNIFLVLAVLFYYLMYTLNKSQFYLHMASLATFLGFEYGIVPAFISGALALIFELFHSRDDHLKERLKRFMTYLFISLLLIGICEGLIGLYTVKAAFFHIGRVPERLVLWGQSEGALNYILCGGLFLIVSTACITIFKKLFGTHSQWRSGLLQRRYRILMSSILALAFLVSCTLAVANPIDFHATEVLPIYYILPPFGLIALLIAFSLATGHITKIKIGYFMLIWVIGSLTLFSIFWRARVFIFAVGPLSILASTGLRGSRLKKIALALVCVVICSSLASYFDNIVWVSTQYEGKVDQSVIEALRWVETNIHSNSTLLYIGLPGAVNPVSTFSGRLTQISWYDWWWNNLTENDMLGSMVNPTPLINLFARLKPSYIFVDGSEALSNGSFATYITKRSKLLFKNARISIFFLPDPLFHDPTMESVILFDDSQTKSWQVEGFGEGNLSLEISEDSLTRIRGLGSLRITVSTGGSYQWANLRHVFPDVQDWSDRDFISFFWHGNRSELSVKITIVSGAIENHYYYFFRDDETGWDQKFINLAEFTIVGFPSLSKVSEIWYSFSEPAEYNLDQVNVSSFPKLGGSFG